MKLGSLKFNTKVTMKTDYNIDINKLFIEAIDFHRSGELEEALKRYEVVVARQNRNYEALNLLGVVNAQLGRHRQAVEFIGKALEINNERKDFLLNRANAYCELCEYYSALSDVNSLLKGGYEDVRVYIIKSNALRSLQRYEEALLAMNKAADLDPSSSVIFYHRGVVLAELKKYDESIESLKSAVEIEPNHADALNEIGVVLCELNGYEEAISYFNQCLKLRPDDAVVYNNKGNALHSIELYEEAILCFDFAIKLNKMYASPYKGKANALAKLNLLKDSIAMLNEAVKIKPDFAEAFNDLGNVHHDMGSFNEAIGCFNKAININPTYPDAYWNKSLTLLLNGNFEEGWPLYEWRWKTNKSFSVFRSFDAPLYTGEKSLKNKTILIYSEQGLGDCIQFSRYVTLLVGMGANVVFQVPLVLKNLLSLAYPEVTIVDEHVTLPIIDYCCPLLSLPLAFKTDQTCIPLPKFHKIISGDNLKKDVWLDRLGVKSKPRVGLAWSGNPIHRNDKNRSLRLEFLLNYLSNDFDYISLQKDVRDYDVDVLLNSKITSYDNCLNDFCDTAGLCQLMDLVISVDTSVAHLAASLNKPTWILLPFSPDWRWQSTGRSSPWYPTVKLYRQDNDKTWSSVLEQLALDLNQMI